MEQIKDSAVLAYIRHVLDNMQISPTALAKLAGVSSTTLTRPLNNPHYKFNLSATTLEKIANVSGINPGPFFESKDFATTSLATFFNPNVFNEEKWGPQPTDHKSIVIIGFAALGIWQEVTVRYADFMGAISVAPIDYSPADCFVVIAKDSHASSFAYQDDLLLCVRREAWSGDIPTGTFVVLERRKEDGRLVELTARIAQKVKSGWQLSTTGRGRSAYHQITLNNLEGDDEASVIGIVMCSIRYPM